MHNYWNVKYTNYKNHKSSRWSRRSVDSHEIWIRIYTTPDFHGVWSAENGFFTNYKNQIKQSSNNVALACAWQKSTWECPFVLLRGIQETYLLHHHSPAGQMILYLFIFILLSSIQPLCFASCYLFTSPSDDQIYNCMKLLIFFFK